MIIDARRIAEQYPEFVPDFLQIPTVVINDESLQPLDGYVYAIVYWMQRLKNGRCYASNAAIGSVVNASASGVANSLVRLRDAGYIQCLYDEKNHRKEIITLVYYSVNPYSDEEGAVTQTSNRRNNIKKENYTSEMLENIEKAYLTWLKYMVVAPEIRVNGTQDERHHALEAAKKHTRLTDKRKAKIAVRLSDAGLGRVQRAILAISDSPFHCGENDRGWKADMDFLFRSYEQIEEWSNKYKKEN